MKTIILAFSLAFAISVSCHAQTAKNTLLIGGSANASFKNGPYITLFPNVGYFIADNLAVGVSTPVVYINEDRSRIFGRGIGPFARYYFGHTAAATRVFAEAGGTVLAVRYNNPYSIGETVTNSRQHVLGAGLGLVHFITPQIGLEARFMYNRGGLSYADNESPRESYFRLSFGLQGYLFRGRE